MSITVLVAPNVAAAKAWCAERRMPDDQVKVVTPKTLSFSTVRGLMTPDIVIIGRDNADMKPLVIELTNLIYAGVL